jgi:hypothetical protein
MAGGGIPKRSEMPITQDRFVHELLEGDIIMYDNQIWKYIKKLSYGGGGDYGYAEFESVSDSRKTTTIAYTTKVERIVNAAGYINT